MTFVDCVEQKIEDGTINEKKAEDAIKYYRDLENSHPSNPDLDENLDNQISERVIEGIQNNIAQEEYRFLHDAKKIDKMLKDLEEVKRFSNDVDNLGEAAIALVTRDLGGLDNIQSVADMKTALEAEYKGEIASVYEKINKQTPGDNTKLDGEKLLRTYLDGENIDEFHNRMADELEKLYKKQAQDLQLAGMNLNARDKYFPNPVLATDKLAKFTYDGFEGETAFVRYVRDEINLDNEQMKNFTNGEPLPDHVKTENFEPDDVQSLYGIKGDPDNNGLFGEIYQNKMSNSGNDELGVVKKQAFRNSHNQMRIIHFDDAVSWMKFNRKFGDAPVAKTIDNHIERVAKDVAAAKRFGTRPDRANRIIKDFIEQRADEIAEEKGIAKSELKDNVEKAKKSFQSNWEAYFEGTYNSSSALSKTVATSKQLTTSATIGSATISAVAGDAGNSAFMAWFNSMPQTRFMTAGVKEFTKAPAQKGLRKLGIFKGKTDDEIIQQMALEAGLTTRAILDESVGYARMLNKNQGLGFTKMMADKSLKWSGLNLATRTKRAAFQIEFGKFLSKVADSARWDEIDDVVGKELWTGREGGFKEMLQRYDIGREEWEILRTMDFHEVPAEKFGGGEGVAFKWFRPKDVATKEVMEKTGLPERELRDISNKFRRMMLTEQEFGVPTLNTRTSAIVGQQDPSSIKGAVSAAVFQYKSFPVTQLLNNTSRAFMNKENATMLGAFNRRAPYMMMAYLVPLAGFGLQMREITKGNDPRDITKPTFWMDSMAQSGSLSIYGDVLFADRTKGMGVMNNQALDVLGGPTFQLADDMIDITFGNAQRAISPDAETKIGEQTAEFLRSWTPMSNMWYSRLATDRILFDTIKRIADPEAEKDFQRQRKRQLRQQNQGSFSPPGSGLSFISEGDLPDVEDAFGGEE